MLKMNISLCKGRGSLAHNNREFHTPNVDKSRSHLNIIYKQEPLPMINCLVMKLRYIMLNKKEKTDKFLTIWSTLENQKMEKNFSMKL